MAVDTRDQTDQTDQDQGHRLRILTPQTGDTTITWDPMNRDEVEAARQAFERLVDGKGYMAYRRIQGRKGEQIREFDPQAREIVLHAQMVGG